MKESRRRKRQHKASGRAGGPTPKQPVYGGAATEPQGWQPPVRSPPRPAQRQASLHLTPPLRTSRSPRRLSRRARRPGDTRGLAPGLAPSSHVPR